MSWTQQIHECNQQLFDNYPQSYKKLLKCISCQKVYLVRAKLLPSHKKDPWKIETLNILLRVLHNGSGLLDDSAEDNWWFNDGPVIYSV